VATITVRVDENLKRDFKVLCVKQNISIQDAIRLCMEEAIRIGGFSHNSD
jgi:antitoxin component of RelBE/YafQ-DinJ toxin-antitoxin module